MCHECMSFEICIKMNVSFCTKFLYQHKKLTHLLTLKFCMITFSCLKKNQPMVLTITTMTTRLMTYNINQAGRIWENKAATESYIVGLYQRQMIKDRSACGRMIEKYGGYRKVLCTGCGCKFCFCCSTINKCKCTTYLNDGYLNNTTREVVPEKEWSRNWNYL